MQVLQPVTYQDQTAPILPIMLVCFASCLAIFGGGWDYALSAGAFRLNVDNAFSLSHVHVGCRLMFMHKEEPKETEEEAA